jgi:hypothetical protein
LMIEAGNATEKKRRAVAVDFVIDLGVSDLQMRHG